MLEVIADTISAIPIIERPFCVRVLKEKDVD